MKIFVPKEQLSGEKRVAMSPSVAKRLTDLGATVTVQKSCGTGSGFSDDDYREAGAKIAVKVDSAIASADIVLRFNKPSIKEITGIKEKAVHISYLDPLNDHELLKVLAEKKISAISMEFIPRSTIAQKMDALSSQANLAGYVSVILAAERINKILPMLITPAGTIPPSRVFIIGAGVAGLQAIATAKRMGARVEAFDTRPVVAEQVESLGAKFVKVDLGETGQTEQGYAKELTKEQLEEQKKVMAKHCAMADIVITTAQVFGRKAPRIITAAMLNDMKAGSVVVDMAVESGGNVEGSVLNKIVTTKNGVDIIGYGQLSNFVPDHASLMYSSNLYNMLEHFWDKETNKFVLKLEDEIIDQSLIVHDGEIRNELVKKSMEKGGE